MFRRLAVLSLALVCVAPAAWARPGGSYQETCDGIRQRGPFLIAECETRDGDTRVSRLDVRGCQGDIKNSNGRLTCERGWSGDNGYDDNRPYGGYRAPRYNPYRGGYGE